MVRSVFTALSCAAVAGCLAASPAHCGAWGRDPGTGFASVSYNWPTDSEEAQAGTVSAYLEYGLPWRLTAGANLDQRPVGPHALELFVKRNVNAPDAELQIAVEAGLEVALDGHVDELTGALSYTADPGQPTLALHLGRGFSSRLGYGWADARFGLNFPAGEADLSAELDATIGLNVADRAFATFEVWHDVARDSSTTSLVPGAGYKLTDRLALTARYVYDADGVASDSVELGAWIDF